MSVELLTRPTLDPLKEQVRAHYDALGAHRDDWYRRNSYYHSEVERRLGALIPPGSSVLELGCGTGNLLTALKPKRGFGLDLSPGMIEVARKNHPELEFDPNDPTGGYPLALRDLYLWMIHNQDLKPQGKAKA